MCIYVFMYSELYVFRIIMYSELCVFMYSELLCIYKELHFKVQNTNH